MVAIKHIAPTFTEEDARRIADELYGIQVEPRALPGEHDRNFHLKAANGAEYVLKISHAAEQRDLLDLQNAALAHLAAHAPTLALPRVQATLAGEPLATTPGADGATHFVRLLTYVPGRLFAVTHPHTPELLHSLGTLLGTMDRALLDFTHPAADRELKWDIPRAAWIRDYLHHIAAPARRTLVERLFAKFERDALPLLPDLRASVIYNDANDYNIVVDVHERGQHRVVGVIDFGDMTRTTTVCELAIALAYAMMDKPDPLAAGAHVIAGYHDALPLTEIELAALYPLALARLCVSVTNSAYQQSIDPANEYLQISDRPAWELLERLAEIPASLAHYTFRHACGLPAVPTAPAVVHWLTDHRAELGRLVEPDLATEPAVIFDLSIGSRDLGNVPDFEDADTFTRNLFAQMEAEGARVGIGRYNETRPIYTTDAYKIAGNDGPEWRTVHLGLDVFMAAGAPVFAPLDGMVHSFRNNDAPKDYGPTIILEHSVDIDAGDIDAGALTFYTLYGHLSLDSLDGLSVGMPVARGARIARMGDETVNGDWPPHLHFQIITDL
ncbi:MAG TPA: phosphotransferase, partial [Ktedonobacterales bacterium]|nr:phosphotransferase [Ktedonobacterales bacterium]